MTMKFLAIGGSRLTPSLSFALLSSILRSCSRSTKEQSRSSTFSNGDVDTIFELIRSTLSTPTMEQQIGHDGLRPQLLMYVKAALKAGIGGHEEATNADGFFAHNCLAMVKLLVERTKPVPGEKSSFATKVSASLASPVFLMVTNHSQFDHIVDQKFEDGYLQLGILRIMKSCVEHSEEIRATADEKLSFSLLRAYDGGTGEKDKIIHDVVSALNASPSAEVSVRRTSAILKI